MDYFRHDSAICESEAIGLNTRVWAFSHILSGAVIGQDCNICDHVFIENDVIVGDRVTIKSGVQLWDGIRIADDVFIGPNVTFTNDKFPRSRQWQKEVPITIVGKGSSIGGNATILPGITIGENSMVGAGAVVTKNVPANAIVYGNPAAIQGYIRGETQGPGMQDINGATNQVTQTLPGNCKFIELAKASDARGDLVAIDFANFKSFEIKRIFYVYNVPNGNIRGEHAHRTCFQFLIAISGSLRVFITDGDQKSEVSLNSPTEGLLISPGIWATQYKFTSDAVLAVLASESYDPDDYIREYSDFQDFRNLHI